MRIRRTTRLIAGLMLATAAATPALGQGQATNDVRCLMASNLFAKASKDPKARKVADASKLFYLGRVTARLSEQQVRAQIVAQTKTITRANAGNVMNACARRMQSGAAMVERVGKQLAARKK